ncbi:hypothetical protein [Burkholderia pseudomallei]|uniref:hypothetical protein n=1 Tax=Burkholderia pseudomallei TaxID=28450 RepID=UPI0029E9537E|nr:hypothetical protein [Burkholderia pseudomallei]
MSIMLMIRLLGNRQFTYRIGEQETCAKSCGSTPRLRARRANRALGWCVARRGGAGTGRAAFRRFARSRETRAAVGRSAGRRRALRQSDARGLKVR